MNEEKDNSNLKVIEFKKPEPEAVPKFVLDMIDTIQEKAKNGKLSTFICHFNFEAEEDETLRGGTLLWNKHNNAIELLGLSELVKSVALECVYSSMGTGNEEEGEKD